MIRNAKLENSCFLIGRRVGLMDGDEDKDADVCKKWCFNNKYVFICLIFLCSDSFEKEKGLIFLGD